MVAGRDHPARGDVGLDRGRAQQDRQRNRRCLQRPQTESLEPSAVRLQQEQSERQEHGEKLRHGVGQHEHQQFQARDVRGDRDVGE